MRYRPERKQAVKERILRGAARVMRRDGIAGASVGTMMAQAGLSHGGFYAYFASKAELAAGALRTALAEGRRQWLEGVALRPGSDWLPLFLGRYLNSRHRDDRETGCAIAALSGELARGHPELRGIFQEELQTLASHLEEGFEDSTDAREQALATVALCVGGMTLARAVADPEMGEAILRACRRYGRNRG